MRSSKSRRPSTRKDKYLIILTVIVIFAVAGGVMLGLKAFGSDEPAPVTLTAAQTISTSTAGTEQPEPTIARTAAETVPAETRTTARAGGYSGDIRSVDWPAVTGTAASPTAAGASTTGFFESASYLDLTGDGNEEALVRVRQLGSGSYLDYFVYTMEDGSPVKLFEKNDVSHGQVELVTTPGSFAETVPVYGPNDPNCCPGNLKVTTYTWSAGAGTFVETSSKTEPAPQT